MLVLSMARHDRIAIVHEDQVVGYVQLIRYDRNKIKLGFEFPDEIEIYREAVLKAAKGLQLPPRS